MCLSRAWYWVATILFAAMLPLNVSTFMSIDLLGVSRIVRLVIVATVFLAAVFPFAALGIYGWHARGNNPNWLDQVLKSAPHWLLIPYFLFFAYALLIGVLDSSRHEGVPKQEDGKYLLMDHSRVVRELSEAEFHERQAYILRAFSAVGLLFSCGSFLVLAGTANAATQGIKGVPRDSKEA